MSQNPEDIIINREELSLVCEFVNKKLTPSRRFTVKCRALGMAYKEIAKELGVSTSRAMQLHHNSIWRIKTKTPNSEAYL